MKTRPIWEQQGAAVAGVFFFFVRISACERASERVSQSPVVCVCVFFFPGEDDEAIEEREGEGDIKRALMHMYQPLFQHFFVRNIM